MTMRSLPALILLSLALTACGQSPAPTDSPATRSQETPTDAGEVTGIMVFDTTVPLTCDDSANTLEKSVERLREAGTTVVNSQCAQLDNASFIAVCGSPNGQFFIHEMTDGSLANAELAGFQLLSNMRDDSFFSTFSNSDGQVTFTIVECGPVT